MNDHGWGEWHTTSGDSIPSRVRFGLLVDPRLQCACPLDVGGCCRLATQEDLRCDECRADEKCRDAKPRKIMDASGYTRSGTGTLRWSEVTITVPIT